MKLLIVLLLALLSTGAFARYSYWANNSDIENLCKTATNFDREVVACVLQFKNKRLSTVAINTCKNSINFDKELDDCALKMVDLKFSPIAQTACEYSTTFDKDQDECLLSLANLDVTERDFRLCKENTFPASKVPACISDVAQNYDNGGGSGNIDLREIRAKINRAINLIDRNRSDSAKGVLEDLLDTLYTK